VFHQLESRANANASASASASANAKAKATTVAHGRQLQPQAGVATPPPVPQRRLVNGANFKNSNRKPGLRVTDWTSLEQVTQTDSAHLSS